MIAIIDVDSRICGIAREALSAANLSVEAFRSTEAFLLSKALGRTEMLILGLNEAIPDGDVCLLTLALESPDLLTYPLSIRYKGLCTLVEFYERQLTVAPEAQARLVSLLLLIRQTSPSVRATSIERFSASFRDAFGSTMDVEQATVSSAHCFPVVSPLRLFGLI